MDVQLPICRKHLFFPDTNDIKGLKRTEPWCTAFSQISKKCLEVSTQGFKWPMVKNHLEVNSTWDLVSINNNSRFEFPWKAHPKKISWKRLPILSQNHNTKIDTIQKNIMTTHYITNPTNKLNLKSNDGARPHHGILRFLIQDVGAKASKLGLSNQKKKKIPGKLV